MFSNSDYQELERDLKSATDLVDSLIGTNKALDTLVSKLLLSYEGDHAPADYEALGYSETAAGVWDLDKVRIMARGGAMWVGLMIVASPLADEG